MRSIGGALTAAILPSILFSVLSWGAPVIASEIDFSTWTCSQFQSANKDNVGAIRAWADGYYNSTASIEPRTDQWAAIAKKLGAYCAAHPDVKLITAADALFKRE